MPGYAYRSEGMQEASRRGRRAMMLHPEWRNRPANGGQPYWETYANDLIADILHGLNSRIDHTTITPHRNGAIGMEAVLARAFATYTGDFDDERDAMPF